MSYKKWIDVRNPLSPVAIKEVETSQKNLSVYLTGKNKETREFRKKQKNLFEALLVRDFYCPKCFLEGINVPLKRFIEQEGGLQCNTCNFQLILKITNQGDPHGR